MRVRLLDGSGVRDYRYLIEDVDRHGKHRIYFRRRGQAKIVLKEIPGTEAFDAQYRQLFRGELPTTSGEGAPMQRAPARPRSLRWLCEQYYASAKFKALAESTRKVRRGILDAVCERSIGGMCISDLPFADMEPRHVAKLRDEKADFPEAANNLVKVIRQLFAWAMLPEYHHAEKNPARDVTRLPKKNPEGLRAWSEADAAKYEARHPIGTKARLAFDLLLYTGVRRSDVVKLGPQMERNGRLLFSETKGAGRTIKSHELPILPPLRESIEATKARTSHLVYLVTAYGRPHSVKGFGSWFKDRCQEAGLENLSAHGLRKLAAQRCAEAGATEHQLMALFGWSNPEQAAVYTRKANRLRLESSAAALLDQSISAEEERNGNEKVQPLHPRSPRLDH
jgi:integrase